VSDDGFAILGDLLRLAQASEAEFNVGVPKKTVINLQRWD
jgi:hypothetical protein